jgi:predicted MFS family arabinose efflux permease
MSCLRERRREDIAAASAATVQQAGIAFGAAVAGLIANASGIGNRFVAVALSRAVFWVAMVFVGAASGERHRLAPDGDCT